MASEYPFGAHRGEESRADLQTEGIDEEHQAKRLGVFEHLGVDREPQVAGQDADKEDEGRAERDAAELDAAEQYADGRNERQDDNRLQGRVFDEE